MKKQLPRVRRKRQKTAQQSLKHRQHWSHGKVDVGEYKTAPEQFANPKNEE